MAGRIALDLKQFKHVKSDGNSTTLQHADGHQLTIAHKPLSQEAREQLSVLGKSAKDASKSIDKGESKSDKQQQLAKGGPVKEYAEGTTNVSDTSPNAPAVPLDISKASQFDAMALVPSAQEFENKDNKIYQDLSSKIEQDSRVKYPGLPDSAYREMGLNLAIRAKENNAADRDNRIEEDKAAALAKDAKIAEENSKKQVLGMAPTPLSQIPQTPEAAAIEQTNDLAQKVQAPPIAQEAEKTSMPQIGQLANDFYSKGQEAIKGAQQTQEEQGVNEELAQNEKEAASTDAMASYQNATKELEKERLAHMQDIKNGYIDPEKYWKGDPKTGEGSHSKIAAGIGMILAGFAPANGANAAIDFLKYQMDKSIDAQTKNLTSNHNLLAANLTHFKNIKDAADMTRLQLNDVLTAQLGQAAATAKTDGARSAALAAQSKLAADSIPIAQNLQMRQALMSLSNDPSKSAGSTGHMINLISTMNPEMAKSYRSRYYAPFDSPGGKPLADRDIPESTMSELTAKQNLHNAAADMLNWAKTHSTILPGTPEYRVGQQKAITLQQLWRSGTLQGVFRQGEQPLLDKVVDEKNPAGLLKEFTTVPKMEELLKSNAMQTNNLANSVGLHSPHAAKVEQQMTPQVKIVNGVKYMRGPDGRAIPVK